MLRGIEKSRLGGELSKNHIVLLEGFLTQEIKMISVQK